VTPEQYLTQAEEHLAAGRFTQATACASIAAARAAIAAMLATEPPGIYPGRHKPAPVEWCGKCYSPRKRYKRSDRGGAAACETCNSKVHASASVRACRYCGAYIQRKEDSPEVWVWVDARGSIGCPEAPDPQLPAVVPEEADLNRDEEWAEFLQHLSGGTKGACTAEQILASKEYDATIPRTRFGELPHPEQLSAWLRAREGRQHGDYLVNATGDSDGAVLWLAKHVHYDKPSH
jgi:hypothetical protein